MSIPLIKKLKKEKFSALACYGDAGFIDPNTTLEPVILTRHENKPAGEQSFYYIYTTFYMSISETSNRVQKAIGYANGEEWNRVYYNGAWTDWEQVHVEKSGKWTPKITTVEEIEPTVTYTTRRGYYKKIGSFVYIECYIRGKITALNGVNNYIAISGLPFNNVEVSLGEKALDIGQVYSLTEATDNLVACIYNNRIRIQNNYGSGATKLKITDTSYFALGVSGWYRTDN